LLSKNYLNYYLSYNHQSIILTNLLLKHDLIYYGNNCIHIFRLPKLTANLLIKQTKTWGNRRVLQAA